MEKFITLAIIDEQWKEHLRDMDDLKQSVQNAVYEQKDPLLIYKFEGFELFKQFIARLNEETITFLSKAEIPVQEADEVHEARAQRRQNLREQKDESRSALEGDGQPNMPNRPPMEKTAPVKSQKIMGRNERVSVQYS
jgi:preprotein translocase subunit SecA